MDVRLKIYIDVYFGLEMCSSEFRHALSSEFRYIYLIRTTVKLILFLGLIRF